MNRMNDNNTTREGEKRNNGLAGRVMRFVRWLWGALSHNIWLKIVSLLLAILLWNYVITTNTSITRTKTLTGLTGYVSGQSALSSNDLALLDDPAEALSSISVTVDAPQAYFSRISTDNVQVSLDLSSVRTAGTQEVPLRAATSYGRVTEIIPESLTLTFEAKDSRSVPVNSVIAGEVNDDYWYSVSRLNPSYLTISGAASVVRSIGSATVSIDVTGHTDSYTQALPYALFDTAGEGISQEMLSRSSSSVSVSVDVYPTKELPVSTDIANVTKGQPAEGYVVQSVTVQPDTVTVAADEELLEGLTELMIEPVDVQDASQSFAVRAAISQLSGLRNLSSEQVYVNVTIAEASAGGWIEDVGVMFQGKAEGLSVEYNSMNVYVTGPRSEVEHLQQEGISVSVDLTGLGAGVYEMKPQFDQERYPNIAFQPEHETMTVTLADVEADE